MTNVCREAAEVLSTHGVEAEVIDLLSLAPLDEDWPDCSMAATVAALVADKAVDYLDGPIKTVNGARTPVPYSGVLESAYVPSAEQVVAAALSTLRD